MIRTHNQTKRAAADPRLRPRGHRDRLVMLSAFDTPLITERIISRLRRRYWMRYCCGGRKIGRYSATVVLLVTLVFQLLILYGTFAWQAQHPASWTNGVWTGQKHNIYCTKFKREQRVSVECAHRESGVPFVPGRTFIEYWIIKIFNFIHWAK